MDFINVLNMIGNKSYTLTMEDVYKFRQINREIYNKAELMADLNGIIMHVREIRHLNLIGTDLANYSITIADSNATKLNIAMKDINMILKNFLKRFSYLSSITHEESDKYEYFLNTYPLFDVVRCGESVVITI